jgi:hypothetical protein
MNRLLSAAFVVVLMGCGSAKADEHAARAILDKAIKAMGGEERLSRIKACTVKGKGTIVVDGDDVPFTFQTTARGIEQYRSTYEGMAGGEKFTGAIVIDGNKGWRKHNDQVENLEGKELENEKRKAYLDVVPVLLTLLKGKGFKLASAEEDKTTTGIRATGPDGKEFTIRFDKDSGLPIRMSGEVVDESGDEFTQETTFEDYREFDGIKVAIRSSIKKDGERYIEVEEMAFKAIDAVKPGTFAEPQ